MSTNEWVSGEGAVRLILGDAIEVLPSLEPDSVDSVVTDPPYGIAFMGRNWDHGILGSAFWLEMLRVAKPGAHLLAFGGTRTFHRLTCAIEDAGWEIRDCIMWVYGSGFPKSLDVSKAIDKAAGVEREVVGTRTKRGLGGSSTFAQDAWTQAQRGDIELPITIPTTDDACQWNGWGTALKPAWEPIIVARKPLAGTVAENVGLHGVGALNVDGCRIQTTEQLHGSTVRHDMRGGNYMGGQANPGDIPDYEQSPLGRWPANVIHDGSDEVLACFPEGAKPKAERQGIRGGNGFGNFDDDKSANATGTWPADPGGSAARFFYCAKASRDDRNEGCEGMEKRPLNWSSGEQNPGSFQAEGTDKTAENNHPTVKPTELMRYLCKLVTPKGGLVLDPFTGSGSTGKACALEGFRFIGIEREADYVAIAKARISHEFGGKHPLFDAIRTDEGA